MKLLDNIKFKINKYIFSNKFERMIIDIQHPDLRFNILGVERVRDKSKFYVGQ